MAHMGIYVSEGSSTGGGGQFGDHFYEGLDWIGKHTTGMISSWILVVNGIKPM